MKIDRNLNLVQQIEREGKPSVHVHSAPISREVFEANYLLVARAHSELFGRGAAYAINSGPKIAALTLKDAGRQNAAEKGADGDGGAAALLMEIRRLTNITAATERGWETLPVDVAVARGVIDADEYAEVEATTAFFTFVCAMTKRAALPNVLGAMASVLGAQITSSNATEFAASLATLNAAGPTTPNPGSSVPY